MRIVIDIEGDQVKVHRVEGDELPPAEVLEKAAAINAQSAGIAKFRRPGFLEDSGVVVSPEDLGVVPTDAGRAPSGPPKGTRTTRSAARKPSTSRRTPSKGERKARSRR